MDDRLTFLREARTLSSSSTLPIRCTFQHRATDAKGEVELQYWPARDGVEHSPTHLTLFILGMVSLKAYFFTG